MKKRRLKDKLALLREREKRLRAELTAERETSAGLSRRVAELAQELHAAGARAERERETSDVLRAALADEQARVDSVRRQLRVATDAHAETKRALEAEKASHADTAAHLEDALNRIAPLSAELSQEREMHDVTRRALRVAEEARDEAREQRGGDARERASERAAILAVIGDVGNMTARELAVRVANVIQ